MSAPAGYVGVLGLREQMQFAGLEGSLNWLVEELQTLAHGNEPVQGLSPAEWAELAATAGKWRESITDLLDLVAKHKAGGA